MTRPLSFFLTCLTSALAVNAQAFGPHYDTAVQCDVYIGLAFADTQPGTEAHDKLYELGNGWEAHAKRVKPEDRVLKADQDAARKAIFDVLYNGNAEEKAAFFTPMGETCQTAPSLETMAFSDKQCAAFARYAERTALESIDHHNKQAYSLKQRGQPQSQIDWQEARVAEARARRTRAQSLLVRYTEGGSALPAENDMGLTRDDGDIVLTNCEGSMGSN